MNLHCSESVVEVCHKVSSHTTSLIEYSESDHETVPWPDVFVTCLLLFAGLVVQVDFH